MTEQFEEMMRKTSRNINVGYVSALFDTAIEYIGKIAVDERIPNPIHKAINPMLDDMIGQLHSMKNNTMATIMFEDGEETKVVKPEEKDSESRTPARDRAIAVHCKSSNIYGEQCFFCRHSKLITERPAYVVCSKLQMEIPSNYTCDKFDKYGQESERMSDCNDLCPRCKMFTLTLVENTNHSLEIHCRNQRCRARWKLNVRFPCSPDEIIEDMRKAVKE